jgi:hypothetical protein
MLTQIAQPVRVPQLTRRLRHEHLATVADRGNPSGAVHVDPDVPLVGQQRLAGVDPHPHQHRTLQRRLRVPRRSQRIRRARERDEERIALRIHLDAAPPRERVAQHPPVLRQRIRVRLAELVQQPRRSLDVGEQERDGAGRQLGHTEMMRRLVPDVYRRRWRSQCAVSPSAITATKTRPTISMPVTTFRPWVAASSVATSKCSSASIGGDSSAAGCGARSRRA